MLFADRVSVPFVRLLHHPDRGDRSDTAEDPTTIATDVEVAAGFLEQLRGLMFRASLPEDYGLVFPFDDAQKRGVHMLFVRMPIDVVWIVEGTVTGVETLQPWTGFARHRADRIVELPAGRAADITQGDRLAVEGPAASGEFK
jgi:uncharacterized membrane protein (UPF0127 family)